MLTVREIQQRTIGFFESKGVPNAKLDTDLLIAYALGTKRLDLYLDLERPLTEAQLDALRPLVKRRANREPLQYILGEVEFCDLKLKVDSRALIPRPETEELIEHIVARGEFAPARVLDLGTGTGAIVLALLSHYTEAEAVAVDLSGDALSLAAENAEALGLSERLKLLVGRWFEPIAEGARFDLIVSNPPYLTEQELVTAEPEVVEHEPESALVSGADGLDDLRRILADASGYLKPGGLLALETGIAQHEQLQQVAESAGLKDFESIADLSGRPRFVFARA